MAFWLLARTQGNRERWAAENVARQGYSYFLPLIDNGDAVRVLFSSYLFVRTPGQWVFLKSTYGICSVIMNGEQPAICPDSAIADLMKRANEFGVISLPTLSADELKEGDAVTITEGPAQGMHGIYAGAGKRHLEKVLLEVMGGKREVFVERWKLIKT